MMATRISEAEVRHISYLSRLNPSDAQVAQASEQLSAIIEYMEQLNEVDTSQVPPTAHALPASNVFREDMPVPGLTPDAALANAPQRDGTFFALPKVLEQDSA